MSANEAIKDALAAGIHFNIDGDDLVLEALAPPPLVLLSLLKDHKADILAILKAAGDWRTLFEGRVVFGECECGLSRERAEADAFKACVATWLNQNPVISPAGVVSSAAQVTISGEEGIGSIGGIGL